MAVAARLCIPGLPAVAQTLTADPDPRSTPASASPSTAALRPAADMIIEGVIVDGGVECPLLQMRSGRAVTLSGFQNASLPIGTRLRLRGILMKRSTCRQGISFETIQRLE